MSLEAKIERIRYESERDDEWIRWCLLNEPAAESAVPDIPGVRGVLTLTDGCGLGIIAIFASDDIPQMRFYVDIAAEYYESIAAHEWECVGTMIDEPLLVNVRSGELWYFPESGVDWTAAGRFELLADDLERFVDDVAIGAGYERFCPPGDRWLTRLRELGFA